MADTRCVNRWIIWWRLFTVVATAVIGVVLLVDAVISVFEQRWAYVGIDLALLLLAVFLGVAQWQDALQGGPTFAWVRRNPPTL